ncbi:MAG: hypothetical protein PHR28_08850 [candidate division Zixibacteria bacterium]|nr:hypothetical protein [candidate division Zixibacteria bacterium]
MAERIRWSEFWYLYGRTLRQMRYPSVWAPLLIQALIAFVLAAWHYYLFSPITGPILSGWVRLISPEYSAAFFHYPAHFVLMPYYFGYARLIVGLFAEALLFGVVIDLFMALYRGEPPLLMTSFRKAAGRYLQLTLVWGAVIIILYLLNRYFFDFLQNVLGYSLESAPRRQVAMTGVIHLLTVLIYALCLFLLPSIMRGGESLGRIIRRALGVSLRHPFVAIGLVLLPYLVGLPASWAVSESAKIVSSFNPELVYILIVISIAVDVPVNFVLLGTSVKFFMDINQSDR